MHLRILSISAVQTILDFVDTHAIKTQVLYVSPFFPLVSFVDDVVNMDDRIDTGGFDPGWPI